MQDIGGANPYEVGLGWSVGKDKDYIGKEATEHLIDNGAKRHLIGFELTQDTEIEVGSPIFADNEEIGKVTSFTYGYTCEKYIGYTLVPITFTPGVEVEIGDDHIKATLTNRIWYDKENARVKGL